MREIRRERVFRDVLEWMHPAFVLALLCPSLYVFWKDRDDHLFVILYFLGLFVVICSVSTRIASRKCKGFPAFLAVCVLSSGLSFAGAFAAGRYVVRPDMLYGVLLYTGVVCVMLCMLAAAIRMREIRRRKAKENNDISWNDPVFLFERPAAAFLAFFVLAYLAGLMNNGKALCDLALFTGLLYLLLLLFYRHLYITERFLQDSAAIRNTPGRKIRTLRLGYLLLVVLSMVPVWILCLLSTGARSYRDLRYPDDYYVVTGITMPEPEPFEMVDFTKIVQRIYKPDRIYEPPAWLNMVFHLFCIFCLLLLLWAAYRAVRRYFLEFRDVKEENEDLASELSSEESRRLIRERREKRASVFSEKEKIRRRYRRVIRRYRKDLPDVFETPAEIEERAVFPPDLAAEALHKEYEQARYGRE